MAAAEPESSAEAEVKSVMAEPEVEPGLEPEPEPDWSIAFDEWGIGWQLHVYIFATFFLIIAVIAVFSACFYLKETRLIKQGMLTFSLQCLLLFFSTFRFLALFINPYYRTTNIVRQPFIYLWELALPGLTASFSVLLLAILDTTKMTLGPPRFQNLTVILGFTACHFAIVVASLVTTMLCSSCTFILLLCQILFIVYGTTLGIGYLYSSVVIYQNSQAGNKNDADNRKVGRLVKITGISSFVSISISITYIYAAASDFGFYSDVTFVDAWDWLILQSVLRLEEAVSCCLVLAIAFRNPLGPTHRVTMWVTKIIHRRTAPSQTSDSRSKMTTLDV